MAESSVASTALGTPVAGLFLIIENVSLPYLYFTAISMVISKFPVPGDSGKGCYSEGNFHFSLHCFLPTAWFVCLFTYSFLLMEASGLEYRGESGKLMGMHKIVSWNAEDAESAVQS